MQVDNVEIIIRDKDNWDVALHILNCSVFIENRQFQHLNEGLGLDMKVRMNQIDGPVLSMPEKPMIM